MPGSFATFGDLLRYLRRRERLTQLELSIVVGYSEAQISRLEKNQRLPDLTAVKALFIPALHIGDEPELVAQLLELAQTARQEEVPAPGVTPYKGLLFFDETDAEWFYGREALTAQLAQRVNALSESNSTRILAVVGASGSGKSSVVRAGLAVTLKHAGWDVVVLTPSTHPLKMLDTQLAPHSVNEIGRRMLYIVDQFEEVFTLCRNDAERAAFIETLLATANDLNSQTTVVLALRADFYSHCAQYPPLRHAIAAQQEYIGQMTREELRQAIEKPAKRGNWEFETGLVDVLLHDIGAESRQDQAPGALPLLSHALLVTWERRRGRTLTLDSYRAVGGVRSAIAETAEGVFTDQLDEPQQKLARDIFLRLTELGEGTEDTRRRAALTELVSSPKGGAQLRAVLNILADARLVIIDKDSAEVAHEALIREWNRLHEWLNNDREGLRLHRQITAAAREWESLERDAGALYRGTRLSQAIDYDQQHPEHFNYNERAFLDASSAEAKSIECEKEFSRVRELQAARQLAETESRRAEEQQRGARRLRWFTAVLGVLLLFALGAAWLAFNQSSVAENNFITAERIRLASQAKVALDNGEGGDLPALLSLQSLKHGYSPEADASLLSALKRGFTQQIYTGHTAMVWSSVFSPDGQKIVTTGADGTARLWDVQTGQELARFAPAVRLLGIAKFAPDGINVVVGGPSEAAWLWDTQTGKEVRQYKGNVGGVWGVDFSSDGKYLVTSDDKEARLFDVQTGVQIREFIGHTAAVSPATFSPDDRFIATASPDKTARLWDVATGKELRRFDQDANVYWVAFSPDGRSLLTVAGKIAQLWDVQTGAKMQSFTANTGELLFGTFSPDGKYLATGGTGKTVQVWDVVTGKELYQFVGHTGGIFWIEFSPDGTYLLTSSEDRTARLWEIQAETEPHRAVIPDEMWNGAPTALSPDSQYLLYGMNETRNESAIWNTLTGAPRYLKLEGVTNYSTLAAHSFSPDGRLLLSGDSSGIVWLWDAQTGKLIHKRMGHSASVASVAFSPDGRLLLSGSEDKTARLWDAQSGKELQQFVGHTAPLRAVSFSPDGKFILTGSDDKTARLWDTQTAKELQQFVGHTAPLRAVSFSPDGKLVATAGDDQTARLWDAQTGKELRQLIGHTGQVSQVVFSPDGQFILTGSVDQTARLWNVQTGQLVRQFEGHVSPISNIGFADDGRTVITADAENVYRWRASLDDIITFTCSQLNRDLTTDERALYRIPDATPTCPKFTTAVKTPGN